MTKTYSRVVWTVLLLGGSAAALAGEQPKTTPPQEPAGFVTGAVIGGFAAGPVGAVLGAGIGTWLGSRVHRAGEAAKAEAQLTILRTDEVQLRAENAALVTERSGLSETNRALTARLDQLSLRIEAAQTAKEETARDNAAKVLDGLQGDVLFRTGSADIAPEMSQAIQVLAQAVAKSPGLEVRVDGYTDPRGTANANLKLSEARANAVRDLFLAAGVSDMALEVNAYGKSQSVAQDEDGYALERRVRLTLQAPGDAAVAQAGGNEVASAGSSAGGHGEVAPANEKE